MESSYIRQEFELDTGIDNEAGPAPENGRGCCLCSRPAWATGARAWTFRPWAQGRLAAYRGIVQNYRLVDQEKGGEPYSLTPF